MLQQVLVHIHNYFIQRPNCGRFSLSGNMISPSGFLLNGQRFWIVGSALNDGVYTFHPEGCTDDDDAKLAGFSTEEFSGTVCALAIPKHLLDLITEISEWESKYGEIVDSPYISESFGGYQYSKSFGRSEGTTHTSKGWTEVFKGRLNPWRKLC